ncbi:hypothetical protein D3C84_742350 [compost metagenome]
MGLIRQLLGGLLWDKQPEDRLAQAIHDALKEGTLTINDDGQIHVDVSHPAFIAGLSNMKSLNLK